jgi:hypothetical protein
MTKRAFRSVVAARPRATPMRSDLAALLLTLAVALLVLACERSPSAPEAELSFQTIAKTTVTGNFVPQIREVVRDRARFETIWRELWGGREIAAPAIDFEREMVVAASGALVCFDVVEIERITLEGGGIAVGLTEATPSSLCLCAGPQSTFHIVRLRRLPGGERFVARSVPPSCPA